MTLRARPLAMAVLASALVTLLAGAQPQSQPVSGLDPFDRAAPDIPRSAQQRRLALTAAAAGGATAAAVTVDEVGDVDSFGRNLRWLGVTDMAVELGGSCPPADPDAGCQLLNPAPALTSFAFEDLGHITLPGKAAHSLLCYWFSPVLTVTYANPTAASVNARLVYTPTLTVESEVLATPGLIDPTTGLPFDGKLLTGLTSSERFEVPLAPGVQFTERTRDSAVCIAGFLSRRTLVDTFGLTEAQAKEVFKKPMTVRMNISGSTQYVEQASLYFGFRIIGD